MTIEEQITRIKNNIADTYTALEDVGATLPEIQNSDNLADTVKTIETATAVGVIRKDEDGEYVAKSFRDYEKNYTVEFQGFQDIAQRGLSYAFQDDPYITSVSFPDLKNVSGGSALCRTFYKCSNLTYASFPCLEQVGYYEPFFWAFRECTSLTTVEFPALVKIDSSQGFYDTFYGCTNLTKVEFPSLEYVGGYYALEGAFSYCSNLKNVSFPVLESASGFNGTFQSCPELESISFPKLKEVSTFNSIVSSCDKIKYLDCPSLKTINSNAFGSNDSLKAFWLPKEIETIGTGTPPFYNCTSLTLYTDVTSEDDIPEGWGNKWDWLSTDGSSKIPVIYNCSHDDFLKIAEAL